MTPLYFECLVLGISVIAGLLGSLLGLGGGIVVIPALTLLFHIDIRYAIGASIVSVIATSSGAAAAYVRERMVNLRVAMFLEMGTTAGALSGAYLGGLLSPRWLYIAFALILGYSSLVMMRHRAELAWHPGRSRWADRLRLHNSYFDEAEDKEITYRVANAPLGLVLMYLAGIVSGLLGIGSGALKVPAMDMIMKLPIKASTATSNFMIGVTAAASAGVYFSRGYIDPFIAGAVATGVLIGATLGSRMLGKIHSRKIRMLFVAVLLVVSAQMLMRGIRG